MPGSMSTRSRISPILVGRDDLLALGERRSSAAASGSGQLLFLAGEAGIGKTRLLGAMTRSAERLGLRRASAATSPRDLELAGSILLDLGDELGRQGHQPWREVGRALVDRFGGRAAAGSGEGDEHRARRLTVRAAVDLVASLADDGPVVVALEDLHWADDLTLEVVSQLARRIPALPMLVIGTYRSDELYPRVPMREWRSHLLRQRLAEEARLPRLEPAQTATMASLLLGGDLPAPTRLVEELQRRSDGIPLHVEELLGAMVEGELDAAAAAEVLPDTLADAILRRAELLSPAAREAASAAAVIGRSFDLPLLGAIVDSPLDEVGKALAELEARFFVLRSPEGWFGFRHALIGDALAAALDPASARELHRRTATAVAERPEVGDDAFLSAQFELAGVPERAYFHARLAAARAAVLSSHAEALDLARRALRTRPPDLPPREHAALLRAVAAEEAATDDNGAAAEHLAQARGLLGEAGDHISAAELLPPLVAARHLLGDGLESRAGMLLDELGALDARTSGAHDAAVGTRGRLLAALAAAYMLDRRLDEAIARGQEALALAEADGDGPTALHVQATVGACLLFAGRMDSGYDLLERAVRRARAEHREAEAARSYRMIGTSSSVIVEYERGERWLREGVEYAERTEQWNHRHYMAAHLAHVAWASGDWETADGVAERAMADGRGGITTTITALHVRGYLAMGRGQDEAAVTALQEARQQGEEMRELQRFAPAVWGLAENALLSGRTTEALELSHGGYESSRAVRDAAYLFPFLVTGARARLAASTTHDAEEWVRMVRTELEARSIPGTLPAIAHAEGLVLLAQGRTGRAREALAAALTGWRQRRRWWEGTWAAIDLARCLHRSNRPGEAAALTSEAIEASTALGAHPLLERAQELERRLRARHAGPEPWAPLSAREFDVARLVATGMTNREIAEELTIAPKTVAAHVEHILGRLGAARRAEIGAWVGAIELDDKPHST